MKANWRLVIVFVLLLVPILTACGGGATPPATEAAPAATEAAAPAEPAAAEGVNWKAYDGKTLNLLLISHPFVDALKPLLPEFEAKTGMKVNLEVLAEQPGFEKLLSDLSSGSWFLRCIHDRPTA